MFLHLFSRLVPRRVAKSSRSNAILLSHTFSNRFLNGMFGGRMNEYNLCTLLRNGFRSYPNIQPTTSNRASSLCWTWRSDRMVGGCPYRPWTRWPKSSARPPHACTRWPPSTPCSTVPRWASTSSSFVVPPLA